MTVDLGLEHTVLSLISDRNGKQIPRSK